MKKTQSIRQYEPLVTPEGWKDGERRFVIRLSQLLDQLFDHQGRMENRLRALEDKQKGEKNDE